MKNSFADSAPLADGLSFHFQNSIMGRVTTTIQSLLRIILGSLLVAVAASSSQLIISGGGCLGSAPERRVYTLLPVSTFRFADWLEIEIRKTSWAFERGRL